MKKRIWELDALRGLCILGMVVIHLLYDLSDMFAILDLKDATVYHFVKDWGGILFFILSGISVTLGSHPIRRGLIVILAGMICTAVTYGMYKLDMADKSLIIYFGVLHCLGTCMVLWPLLKKLPWWLLSAGALAVIYAGIRLWAMTFDFPWLLPLGFVPHSFASSDYFPLLPCLGYFMAGAVLGKVLYKSRQSLLPKVNSNFFVLRFLQWCGRQSLWIYLLHQPALYGMILLLQMI